MDHHQKIKLSSDLVLTKAGCFLALCFSTIMLLEQSNNIDFKAYLEYKLLFLASLAFLVYFFTRPKIYYDNSVLYIKKINKKEISVPLKNITSFFDVPFSARMGITVFTIEYIDEMKEDKMIKFAAVDSSESLKNFKALIK